MDVVAYTLQTGHLWASFSLLQLSYTVQSSMAYPTEEELRFTAMCFEYLGNGKFTADYRVFGFARAVLRMYGGDPEMIWARHIQSYDAIPAERGVMGSKYVPGAANEEKFGEKE